MQPVDGKIGTHFTIQENKNVRNTTKRTKKVLDANDEKANLKNIVNILKYQSNDKQSLILKLLSKHKEIFDDTLGNYTGSEYKFELLQGAKPCDAKPFLIPKIHEKPFKTEVSRLINIGVSKRKNNSLHETNRL